MPDLDKNISSDEKDKEQPSPNPVEEVKKKRPYVRPELLQYGALDEVTKSYNTAPCQGGCLIG